MGRICRAVGRKLYAKTHSFCPAVLVSTTISAPLILLMILAFLVLLVRVCRKPRARLTLISPSLDDQSINQSILMHLVVHGPVHKLFGKEFATHMTQTGDWLIDWLLEMLPLYIPLFILTRRRTDTRFGFEIPEAFFLLIEIRTLHISRERRVNCEENARVPLELIYSIKQSITQVSVSSVSHKCVPIWRQSTSTYR